MMSISDIMIKCIILITLMIFDELKKMIIEDWFGDHHKLMTDS